MPNLTQDEAVQRAALVDVTSYEVDLDLSDAERSDTFVSTATVRFGCTQPGAATFVEVAGELLRVELDGRPLDVGELAGGRLPLTDLSTDNTLRVTGRFTYSRSGEGLHKFVDPQDGLTYLYSQTAMYEAQRVFACFDQPDLKAPLTLAVTAPASWVVLGNSPATRTGGDPERPARWQLSPTLPLATYFMAVVAGPYHGVQRDHGDVETGLWCRRSLAPHLDAEALLATTSAGLDYYADLFAVAYPFGKYDQVFVPEFNLGAMENPGCVTFRDEAFLRRGTVTAQDRENVAEVQLHEMAHMWFGDLVTMRWWDDLWLNESFAEYLAHRASLHAIGITNAWTRFAVSRKGWGYAADQRSTTHPIAGTVADTDAAMLNVDGISYAKGASALRQLVEWVGDEAFVDAMRTYVSVHAFANATLDDLVNALAAASGRDVRGWADGWLRSSGVNTLAVEYAVTVDGTYESFAVRQTAPDEHPTLRPHRLALGLYTRDDDALRRRDVVPVDVLATALTEVPAMVGRPVADLVLPNEGDLTFALIALDARSLDTVLSDLAALDDPLTRAVLWQALWEDVGHGRLAPSAYADLVVRALGPHDTEQLVAAVLTRGRAAADQAAPARRPGLVDRLSRLSLDATHAAVAGSDTQLAHARALVAVTTDVTTLRGWLDDVDVPAGLVLDADLRWRVLQRLAVLGAAADATIAAESERDPSSSGRLGALTARAALPGAADKERAWAQLTGGTLSNHELDAVAAGFWQRDQLDVVRPYAERYVAELPALVRPDPTEASIEIQQLLAGSLFPVPVIEERTLALVEDLLASGALTATATRVVAERRDDLRRALTARAADR